MKKIACFLLLFLGGIMMAQTETVPTVNGKKIRVTPNGLGTVDNGLTAIGGKLQLGGSLIKETTLETTSTAALALQGLQAGAATDNVMVVDAGGVIKSIERDSIGDNLGNHIAGKDLNMNANSINAAKDITATGKTAAGTAVIALGADGSIPMEGSIAVSMDDEGNIVWKDPEVSIAPRLVAFAIATAARNNSKVYYDTKKIDLENALSGDATNGTTYTVAKDGMYQIFANLTVYAGSTWTIRIYKNGVQIGGMDASNVNGGASACAFGIGECSEGDKITVRMEGSATGYRPNYTRIAVYRFE
ncbi:hypothetical protein [Flavobacterium gelatinilyticum]|mgnify:CR=1 FL=1|uniref:hypothetical protein n=1 Tax=Flavobacterium gelatinilyticum TaxID=3003260 RepID=UPI00248162E7|nr:hypothetical protein [Flavobacterium gelatinilyticum]